MIIIKPIHPVSKPFESDKTKAFIDDNCQHICQDYDHHQNELLQKLSNCDVNLSYSDARSRDSLRGRGGRRKKNPWQGEGMGRRMARREMMEESIWRVFVATPQEGDYSLEHWALTNKVGARQMFRFLATAQHILLCYSCPSISNQHGTQNKSSLIQSHHHQRSKLPMFSMCSWNSKQLCSSHPNSKMKICDPLSLRATPCTWYQDVIKLLGQQTTWHDGPYCK